MTWFSRLVHRRRPPEPEAEAMVTVRDAGHEPRMVAVRVVRPARVEMPGRTLELTPGHRAKLTPTASAELQDAGAVTVEPWRTDA